MVNKVVYVTSCRDAQRLSNSSQLVSLMYYIHLYLP